MNKYKIFCIGTNKTGTTSLADTFKHLGYKVGNQREAELLANDCFCQNYKSIIEYCKTADFFQDTPFSKTNIYEILEKDFPDAKFILSIRDSPLIWYNSLLNYHNKIFYKGNEITCDLVKNITYVEKGWFYNMMKNTYKTPDEDLYNKDMLISFYENHNNNIINYFKDKPSKLLIINLSNKDDFNKMLEFLDIKETYGLNSFYHSNKT